MTALAVLLAVTKVGIIGCDTSHTIAFTKTLNVDRPDYAEGFRVMAAHKWGSKDNAHLKLVENFNGRADNPTAWREDVYRGPDFLAAFSSAAQKKTLGDDRLPEEV